MGRVWPGLGKHRRHAVLVLVLAFSILRANYAVAQTPEAQPCNAEAPDGTPACAPGIPLSYEFHATPLMDGNPNLISPPQPAANQEIVTLYGGYGNDESIPAPGDPARNHYEQGRTRAALITPRDRVTGNPTANGSIIFLFIGFSNCSIEVCGGSENIWKDQDPNPENVKGQPCATSCPNPKKFPLQGYVPWNDANDQVTQRSFLYQVYSPQTHLVGDHVFIFDGAVGGELLNRWDPSAYYADPNNLCIFTHTYDPECDYTRIAQALSNHGFSEKQVQAIFIKSSNGFPQCDLSLQHCRAGQPIPDAYLSERYLGNILRYLKQSGRYPNLQQVFITSRIYGGYATDPAHHCLMPEPFAYEEAFGVQRLIVAQIKQAAGIPSNDIYSGAVSYNDTPWFDWGPYLWADGKNFRSDGLNWCKGQGTPECPADQRDVRDGDLFDQIHFWGDYAHPAAPGAEKVANQLVKFITGQLPAPQSNISNWVLPWKVT